MKRIYESILQDHFSKEAKMAFVVGPRQVGKTTSAQNTLSRALYLNWDNQEHRHAILKGPQHVFRMAGGETLQNEKLPVIFDELHKYPRWKTFLKGFYDTYAGKVAVCVSGSARLNVYKHGGDSLMGRYFLYRMHPLSVGELLSAAPLENLPGTPRRLGPPQWNQLLEFGGYPEPYLRHDKRFYNRWKNLRLELLFNEDLRDLSSITDIGRIKVLAEQIANSAGGMVNYSHLSNEIQVSVDTIRRWFDILESIYFCYRIRPYSKKILRSLLREPKVYLWDWSMVKNPGMRNENFIASHLLKAIHYCSDMGMGDYGLYYLRDKSKREVDFLVTRDGEPWFLAETKTGDKPISESLHYFKKITAAPHAFQIAFNRPHVDADCFKETSPVIVPAVTFLSQLV